VYYNWNYDRYDCIGWALLNNSRKYDKYQKVQKAWEWNEQLKPENERIPYVPPFEPGPELPRYNHQDKVYEATYYKDVGGKQLLWKVRCKDLQFLMSQNDIELTERNILPKECRPIHPLNGEKNYEYIGNLFNRKKSDD
jgi:hypothetical protein